MLEPRVFEAVLMLKTNLKDEVWTHNCFVRFISEHPDLFGKYFANPVPTDLPWQSLARQPGMKIPAIKLYREMTGSGLADAKYAVEDWMAKNNVLPSTWG